MEEGKGVRRKRKGKKRKSGRGKAKREGGKGDIGRGKEKQRGKKRERKRIHRRGKNG